MEFATNHRVGAIRATPGCSVAGATASSGPTPGPCDAPGEPRAVRGAVTVEVGVAADHDDGGFVVAEVDLPVSGVTPARPASPAR